MEPTISRHGGITEASGAQLGAQSGGLTRSRITLQSDPYAHSAYAHLGECVSTAKLHVSEGWNDLLQACRGLIAFDVVLCPHNPASLVDFDPRPKMASIRLLGCASCGSCPEGPAFPDQSPEHRIPLLSPPPLHTSKVAAAQRLDNGNTPYPPFIVRCRTCLKDRWCERCNTWWCESCYTVPKKRTQMSNEKAAGIYTRTAETSLSASIRETSLTPLVDQSIKVHNGLCISKCLMDELLNGVGEGGMWG